MIKHLAAAAVTSAALAAPASAASFDPPRTLAADARAQEVVAAHGAVAWQGSSGVWLAAGAAPRQVSDGPASLLAVAAAPGETPAVSWVDRRWRLHVHTAAGAQTIAHGYESLRSTVLTPRALGLVGVTGDGTRVLEVARREDDGRFGAATAPAGQSGRPSYGLSASGNVFAWHSQDGDVRRVETLTLGGRPAWRTGPTADASLPDVAGDVLAWVDGVPARAVSIAPLDGPAQTFAAPNATAPRAAATPGGTAVVAWMQLDGTVRAALRQGGAFGEPVAFPAADRRGYDAAVTAEGDAIVAYIDGTRLYAAVARAGRPFGAPEPLADGVQWVVADGGDVSWIEGRAVRTAHLAGAPAAQPAADRRKPKLRVKVLGRKRVRVRSDERGTLRATWRSGRKVVGRTRAKLRAGKPRVIRTRRRAARVEIRVSDRAGNVARVKRKLR